MATNVIATTIPTPKIAKMNTQGIPAELAGDGGYPGGRPGVEPL